jgi:small-conductance mechanosensitive channel
MLKFLEDSPVLQQLVWFAGILLLTALIGWIVLFVMQRVHRSLAKRPRAAIFSRFVSSLTKPVFIFILIQGLIQALRWLPVLESWRVIFSQVGISVIILFSIYAVGRIVSVLLEWYLSSEAFRRAVAIDEGLVRFLKRVMIAIIYTLGVLIILDYYGVSISPILASLGIGGLAIALALQPMLANFFAGTQIVSDRVVRVGDFVELEDGLAGFVTDVGWRSIRIRTLIDTVVIVPNTKLAESIVTNHNLPDQDLLVEVRTGVKYESDLFYVESVVKQVAQEIIDDCDEAVKEFRPWFSYDECGDANINFRIRIKAKDYISALRLRSELIKRLRTRFQKEEIDTTMITG